MGIIFSFLLLALILIIFKSLGMFVGWGFQFQNIYFLTFLSIIIFLFSLNLLGFFEIILPNRFMNYLGKIERQQSHYGYFFFWYVFYFDTQLLAVLRFLEPQLGLRL